MNSCSLIISILISILTITIFLPEKTNAGCTCDAWCRGRDYRGGICGDGHTCMCNGRRGRRAIEIPVNIIEQKIDADFANVNANY